MRSSWRSDVPLYLPSISIALLHAIPRLDVQARVVEAMLAGDGFPEGGTDLVTLHSYQHVLVLPKSNDNIRIAQPGVAPVQESLVSCVFLHRRHTDGGHACGLRAQVDQWTLTISRMLADLEGPSGDGGSGTVLIIARVVTKRGAKGGVNGSCSLAKNPRYQKSWCQRNEQKSMCSSLQSSSYGGQFEISPNSDHCLAISWLKVFTPAHSSRFIPTTYNTFLPRMRHATLPLYLLHLHLPSPAFSNSSTPPLSVITFV